MDRGVERVRSKLQSPEWWTAANFTRAGPRIDWLERSGGLGLPRRPGYREPLERGVPDVQICEVAQGRQVVGRTPQVPGQPDGVSDSGATQHQPQAGAEQIQ